MSILRSHEIESNLNIYDNIVINYCLILNQLRSVPLPSAKKRNKKKKMESSKTTQNSSLYLWTIVLHIVQLALLLGAAGWRRWQGRRGMYQAVSTVSTDLEMMLQLMMKVPFVVSALASGIVVLYMVRRRVRMAQGRAMALVVRMRTGNRDRRRKLIHARRLLMFHHRLLLLRSYSAGWWLLRRLLIDRLPLCFITTFAARIT